MKLIQDGKDALLKPLQSVSGVVERRHTLPILSNVLLERQDGKLRMTATDLEIQVSSSLPCGTSGDPASVTISARKFHDILRSLPDGTDVTLEAQANRVSLKAARSRFSLQTLPPEDFPRMAEASAGGVSLTLPQGEFKRLLGLVQYAMAQQDIRYYLNGLLLVVSGRQLKLVATDGHRLAYASQDLAEDAGSAEVILPRKAVIELFKLLGEDETPVSVLVGGNQVRFAVGEVVLLTKVVDGKFPDYTRVIPTNYTRSFTLERTELQQALQRAAILSNEKFRGVRWMITAGSLRVSCTNNEQEEANEELEIAYDKEALDIGFNVNYLLDVLSNVTGDAVTCSFGDASSSVLITVAGYESFKYVIMPMRI